MTKNLNLLRRTNNRTTTRPPQSTVSNEKRKPENEKFSKQNSIKGNDVTWDNLRGKLYFYIGFLDTDWRLSLSTIFKVDLFL